MKLVKIIVAFLAIMTAGCNSGTDKLAENPSHEDAKVLLVSYSPNLELFAETDPFVAGESGNILAHFTRLPGFKPIDSCSVTVRLIVGAVETTRITGKPLRRGIYSFEMTPTVPGDGRVVFEVRELSGGLEVLESPVTIYADEETAQSAATGSEPSATNTIVFTKEQSWKVDFSTEQPEIQPFGQVIRATALIESAADDEVTVASRAGGVVVFSDSKVTEGQYISSGEPLFTISGEGLADNNSSLRYSEALNNYEKAKADYERQAELAKDRIVSEKELLSSKNEFDNAAALYEMLKKNFNASGQVVSCPSSGYVKHVFVKNGQFVDAGQPLISVTKNKTIILKTGVPQKYYPVLNDIKSANVRIPATDKTYSLEQLDGKVISYGRNADPDNYLIPVVLQINNAGDFIPGGFVEVFLKTITNANALTVPNSALLEDQGIFFVLVQVTPEMFEKREVTVGSTDGLRSDIISGLSPTERIVTRGAILVKLAQASGTLDAHAGHVH